MRKRPDITKGETHKVQTGCGNMYLTINTDDENNFNEMFLQLGKSGSCTKVLMEAIGRLVTLIFRLGGDVNLIVTHLKGLRCLQPRISKGKEYLSCCDAIAQTVENYGKEREIKNNDKK